MKTTLQNILKTTFFVLAAAAVLVAQVGPASAAEPQTRVSLRLQTNLSGLPSSPEFGFGVGLNERAANLDNAVRIARQTGFDWLAVEFNWAEMQPAAGQAVDFRWLKNTTALVEQQKANLLIRINNAPAWALTAKGPSAELTAKLVAEIVQNINVPLAVELFPGANIASNWGAPASPAAYVSVLRSVQGELNRINPGVILIPSISPLGANRTDTDIPDLDFLKGLYEANNGAFPMSVIGLNFSNAGLAGEPATNPANQPDYSLRHYEQVHAIMTDFNQQNAVIWVTSFAWPSALNDKQVQASWLTEAYKLLQGQLFIGAAFYSTLNAAGVQDGASALVGSDQIKHPALQLLSGLMQKENPGKTTDENNGFFSTLINAILSLFGGG